MASTASRFSSAICCVERVASLVRSFSDISDRNVQKSSTEADARIVKRSRRSETAAAPAFEKIVSNLPGSAKRKASGESGAGLGESTYRSTIFDKTKWNGFLSAKCQTAKAILPPGLSTRNISRIESTGDGKNMTPKRLTTASKLFSGKGRWSPN